MDLVNYQLQSANIAVTRDIDKTLPQVVASWEHLKSVWLNLLLNARDALLHTNENRQLEVITRLDKDGQSVQVLIHDNGKGMTSAETLHIFEPFYTTKGLGKVLAWGWRHAIESSNSTAAKSPSPVLWAKGQHSPLPSQFNGQIPARRASTLNDQWKLRTPTGGHGDPSLRPVIGCNPF